MSTAYEATWTAASRKAHKANGGYFAGPDDTYPLKDASDVDDAYRLAGHAANPDQVRANIKRWAKDNGHYAALPDTAKGDDKEETNPKDLDGQLDDGKKQESAATITSSVTKPRQKIATLNVCFLEYNARSLNGRIYPKATCDAIYASGVKKLADTNSLPITVFVSHEAANGNANTELVGAARRLWQDGSKFYAGLDLADTRTAWDMLGLCEGGYLRSESMRVLGVELVHDRNHDLPLVVPQEGVEPELLGIDLTTRPGLMDTARIQQVLYESQQQTPFTESFTLDNVMIEFRLPQPKPEKGHPMPIPIYMQVLLEHSDPQAHQKIHDHLAGVLDATVKPAHGSESARLIKAVESELSEEGKAIAKQHAVRLSAAHDIAAHHAGGMECEGCYKEALGIPLDSDQDGDGIPDNQDPNDQKPKGEENLTPEQMMEALKAQGYNIEPPKTKEQELQESFDAKLAAQKKEFSEQIAALQNNNNGNTNNPPQRQTQSLGGVNSGNGNEFEPEYIYQEGDYLQGKLHPKNWKALANRRVPWPQDVDPNQALFELAPFMTFRIMEGEANARGMQVPELAAKLGIGPHEDL